MRELAIVGRLSVLNEFSNICWPDIRNRYNSDKVAEVSYASMRSSRCCMLSSLLCSAIQGRDCLVQKFRNSSVMLEHPSFRPKVTWKASIYSSSAKVVQIFHTGQGPLAGTEDKFPGPDNPSKMRRSVENAEHVGRHHGSYYVSHSQLTRLQVSLLPGLDRTFVMSNAAAGRSTIVAPVLPKLKMRGTSTWVITTSKITQIAFILSILMVDWGAVLTQTKIITDLPTACLDHQSGKNRSFSSPKQIGKIYLALCPILRNFCWYDLLLGSV